MEPQTPPQPTDVPMQQPLKQFPVLPTLLSVLILLLLSSTFFLAYQNRQLTKQIKELQIITSPTPMPLPNVQITPTPTCRPRPACLDATPRCMIPETSDMCPKASPTPSTTYTCPPSGYVDCMPILDAVKQKACSAEAITWYKANCPNFKGGAL